MSTLNSHGANLQYAIESFSLFDDWEERYRYLIDIGRTLPIMDESLKNDQTLVRGCTSRVWLYPTISGEGVLTFVADSDAHIVRGLIALLHTAYNGVNVNEIAAVDVNSAFDEIGLSQNLSPNRRSGFFSMVERIRGLAV
jgi:cysteine desulfuration protein SufE